MKSRQLQLFGLAAIALLVGASAARADDEHGEHSSRRAVGLVKEVLQGTRQFRDVNVAESAGWLTGTGCVSGPNIGAMGVHFINGSLVGDGTLDPQRPEALIYEAKGHDRLRLVGVEFLAIAEVWDAANPAPPVLLGQHFHYTGAPNRYGLPPFYSLHVWAWRNNPLGMFVNWNPRVSCEKYTADAS